MEKSRMRNGLESLVDRARVLHSRRNEINKYKDARRKEIYSSIELTEQQKSDIDTFFIRNYGEKIPYTWHRHYTAFTGKFDVQYFPELLYIPEFEHFMNLNKEYLRVFSDKNVIPILAEKAGVETPETIVSCTKGAYRDASYQFIKKTDMLIRLNNIGEAFVKPSVDSNSGRGCFIIDVQNGIDKVSGKKIIDIVNNIGNDFVIQKRLICSDSLRNLYPDSVNTFRIITYRWKEEIRLLPVIMRFGRGGNYLDNAHAGGGFIGVSEDGVLNPCGYTEFKEVFQQHPDTHVTFEKYKINNFHKVLAAAKRMHEMIPQVGCVNWDFSIGANEEPILIEANMNGGSIWLIELAHGKGAFGEHTAEILRWMKLMKKIPLKDRAKYSFGRIEE